MGSNIAAAITFGDSSGNCISLCLGDTSEVSSIGERVQTFRAARQLSQAKLAELVGVSQPTIANIERGRTLEIKGYVLAKLAAVLHTTPEYILTGGDGQPGAIDGAADQAELLGIFRQLSSEDRAQLLRVARGMIATAAPSPLNPFPKRTKSLI